MNTSDEHAKEVSQDAAGEVATMKQDGSAGVITLFFFIGFIASLILGWVIFPKLLYSQKKQPFDFSHAFHVETVDNGCESCHFFREDGSFSGAPKLAQCIECHEEVQGDSPDEKTFVEEYVAKEREVPWLIYAKQPNCVFFSHVAHVKTAKMDCTVCHGPMGESDHLRVYEENRITGYSRDIWGENMLGLKRNTWDRMKMDDCAACHEEQIRIKSELTSLPWPLNWAPLLWKDEGGNSSSVQTERDACFVCHK